MARPTADPALDVEVLNLAVLGPPEVRWGKRVVTFRTRKEFAFLVYVALARTPQPREHLAALFWPDLDTAAARNGVRTTLSRLRQHLAAAGETTVAALTVLRAERDALGREVVGLACDDTPAVRLDVGLLEASASPTGDAAATADGEAEMHLQAAAAAYRGPFLKGMRFDDVPELEEWVGAQRAYWHGQVERVLEHLATLQLRRRAGAEASATARRWLGLNALSEPAYRALMRALAAAGDRAGALAAYEECRGVLRSQLAVDPSPDTVALAERLRRLPGPASATRRADGRDDAPTAGGISPFPRDVELPFVGREREFAALVAAYQAAQLGQVQVVVLEGEAGSGKTCLAEEFLRWATLGGADVLRGRGYEARGTPPYQLMVDSLRLRLAREHAPEDLVADVWLTELVRLFPELRERYPDLPAPATLASDEGTGQGRLFEAVQQLTFALAERARPAALVVFCDDMQWTDLALRDLILYSLQRKRAAGSNYLLLLAVRAEALASTPELVSWLVQLTREVPTTSLSLGPLAQAETAQALAAVLADPNGSKGELKHRLGAWLHAQTEGQPFYLVETLRALVDRGILVAQHSATGADRRPLLALAPGVQHWTHFVPGTVRGLIRGQLSGLSLPAHELLVAAAVLGPAATFERLCQIAAVEEGAGLSALDELRRRRLVVEDADDEPLEGHEPLGLGPAMVRFPHDLVREVVYTEAGDARRRLFHRRAAALLEGTDATSADLAHHALAAGLIELALSYSVAAGDAALCVFAARDAIVYYERAQRLLAGPVARPAAVSAEQWAHLHLQLAVAYEWVGLWAQARDTYQALREHSRAVDAATLAGRALTRLAFLTWFDALDLAAARALAAEALEVLGATEDRDLLAQAHWAAAVLGHIAGEPELTRMHARQAEELAHAAGRRELVAGSLFVQGVSAVESGDWDESVATLRRGGALYAKLAAEQAARFPARGAGETPPHVALYPWMGPGDAVGYIVSEAECVALEGRTAICRGEPHRGIERGRKALDLALERANAEIEVLARDVITAGLVEAGHYAEALRVGRPGLERAREPGEPTVQVMMVESWAYAQQGLLDLAEAQLAVAEALERAEQLAVGHWYLRPLSLLCANLALAGDWTGAFEAALRAVSLRETLQARLLALDFARHYEIEALVRGGYHELAQADVRRLGERLRRDGSDRRYWLVYHRMQAALARGDGAIDAARRYLVEALRLAEEIGLPGEEWPIAAELAALSKVDGAPAEAAEALERAEAVIASLAADIDDQSLRDRFHAAAFERARLLAT
ncbi:MAG: hypothetical protein JWO42_2851 [Chloroflexi bacterium]|nr:hypothetical protein [Chloroflexota bacterium]